jgi:hypothetical protein
MASITISPNDPPVAGTKATICKEGGTLPSGVTITFEPSSIPPIRKEWNTDNGGCVTIDIPAEATNILIEDDSEEAPYRDRPVVPPT